MVIKNSNIALLSGIVHGDIYISDGIIEGIEPSGKGFVSCDDYIMPGFIDIHVHGGDGYDFMDGSEEAFKKICDFHLAHGTVGLCPTTLTATMDELKRTFDVYRSVKNKCSSHLLGLHLEGPYVSPCQLGAQDPKYAHLPSDKSYYEILDYADGAISIWTVAPELEGTSDLIQVARQYGIKISIGHSDAIYDDVIKAEEAGATMVTHLFSSMSTIKRVDGVRVPGVLESALLSDHLMLELIADGMHVPAPLIKLVLKCVPEDNLILVTDAMRGSGMTCGESVLGSLENGQKVTIRDGVARMPDGVSFAGSIATSDRLLRTIVNQVGLPVDKASRMLSHNPARALGVDDEFGAIDIGRRADLVVMDSKLNVVDVMLSGQSIRS